jgi:hypothetical protein
MKHLRRLNCYPWSVAHFRRLLEGDAPIPPLENAGAVTIDATTIGLLLKLAPTLTHLDRRTQIELPNIQPVLSQLKGVTHLDAVFYGRARTLVHVDSLVAGLQSMPQLHFLTLAHPHWTSEHLSAILPELRQLARLELCALCALCTASLKASVYHA